MRERIKTFWWKYEQKQLTFTTPVSKSRIRIRKEDILKHF